MKYLEYQLQTIVKELDESGNETECFIYSSVRVPDDESGRALAAKEAYNGVIKEIEVEETEQEAADATPTNEERLTELEEAVNLLLEGATE